MLGPGTVIGKYVVLSPSYEDEEIVIYRARDLIAQREVGLKIFRHSFHFIDHSKEIIADYIEDQFYHSNVISSHNIIINGQHLVVIVPTMKGIPLEILLRRQKGPWPLSKIFNFMKPLMETIIFAHKKGFVHGDLRPQKISVYSAHGQIKQSKCLDFGLAKLMTQLSHTSQWPGVVPYMAPEQQINLTTTISADVYALGILTWRLLVGRLPVNPRNRIALRNLYNGSMAIPRLTTINSKIPSVVVNAVQQATNYDPQLRHTSVRSFWMHLVGLKPPKRPQRHSAYGSSPQIPVLSTYKSSPQIPVVAKKKQKRNSQVTPVASISSIPGSSKRTNTTSHLRDTNSQLSRSALPPKWGTHKKKTAHKKLSSLPPRWKGNPSFDDEVVDGEVITPISVLPKRKPPSSETKASSSSGFDEKRNEKIITPNSISRSSETNKLDGFSSSLSISINGDFDDLENDKINYNSSITTKLEDQLSVVPAENLEKTNSFLDSSHVNLDESSSLELTSDPLFSDPSDLLFSNTSKKEDEKEIFISVDETNSGSFENDDLLFPESDDDDLLFSATKKKEEVSASVNETNPGSFENDDLLFPESDDDDLLFMDSGKKEEVSASVNETNPGSFENDDLLFPESDDDDLLFTATEKKEEVSASVNETNPGSFENDDLLFSDPDDDDLLFPKSLVSSNEAFDNEAFDEEWFFSESTDDELLFPKSSEEVASLNQNPILFSDPKKEESITSEQEKVVFPKEEDITIIPESAEVVFPKEEDITIIPESETQKPSEPSLNEEEERCYQKNDWAGLVNVLDKKIEQATNVGFMVRLLLQKGEICALRLNNPTKASQIYEEALALVPKDESVLKRLTQEIRRLREWKKLAPLLRQLAESQSNKEEKIKTLHSLGSLFSRKLNELDKAVFIFEQIRDLEPTDKVALNGLESLYEQMDQWEKLVQVLEERASNTEEIADKISIVFQKGTVYADHLQDPNSAILSFTQVIELYPSHMPALNALETLYRKRKDDQNLAYILSKQAEATQIPQLQAGMWEEMAILCTRFDRPELSLQAAIGCLQTRPNNEKHLRTVATFGSEFGKPLLAAQAAENLAEVLGMFGEETFGLLINASSNYQKVGEIDKSIACAKKALNIHPTDIDAIKIIFDAHMSVKAFQEASDVLDRYLAQNRSKESNGVFLIMKAHLAEANGDFKKALDAMLKAHQVDSTLVSKVAVARLLLLNNRTKDTIAVLNAYVRSSPANLEAYLVLAKAKEMAGSFRDAIKIWKHIKTLEDSSDLEVRVALARLNARSGKPRKAFDLALMLLEEVEMLSSAQEIDVRYAAAQSMVELGDLTQARSYLLPVIENKTDEFSDEIKELWGRIENSRITTTDLIKNSQKEINVQKRAQILEKLAVRYQEQKQFLDAIDALDASIKEYSTQNRRRLLLELLTQAKQWRRVVDELCLFAKTISSKAKRSRILLAAAQTSADEVGDLGVAIELGISSYKLQQSKQAEKFIRAWLKTEGRSSEIFSIFNSH